MDAQDKQRVWDRLGRELRRRAETDPGFDVVAEIRGLLERSYSMIDVIAGASRGLDLSLTDAKAVAVRAAGYKEYPPPEWIEAGECLGS